MAPFKSAITILLFCFSVACSSSTEVEALESFLKTPVESRFKASQSKSNQKFLGVNQYTLVVPGVPEYQERYSQSYEVLAIPGTTDLPHSEKHAKLNAKANEYAAAYNQLLVQRLEAAP